MRKYEELTLSDDYMFGAVMNDPECCKPLIELILGKKVARIEYPELQKSVWNAYGAKGIRLDVYVKDEEETVYDMEIQTGFSDGLPKRTRYYQGQIDLSVLSRGNGYESLKKSFVIFICRFDPFGEGRYQYTFENRCLENPSLPLGDGTQKIFLNTKGKTGDISDGLRNFLRYLENQTPADTYTEHLEEKVAKAKDNEEGRAGFMKYELEMAELERKSIAKGRTEGRVEGANQLGRLIVYLQEHSLTDQIALASTDAEARKDMFKKYHIE